MTLEEFINNCVGDFLPVIVKNEDLRFLISASRLECLKDRTIAKREIYAFTIQRRGDDGKLNWFIVVKKQSRKRGDGD